MFAHEVQVSEKGLAGRGRHVSTDHFTPPICKRLTESADSRMVIRTEHRAGRGTCDPQRPWKASDKHSSVAGLFHLHGVLIIMCLHRTSGSCHADVIVSCARDLGFRKPLWSPSHVVQSMVDVALKRGRESHPTRPLPVRATNHAGIQEYAGAW